MNSNNHDYSPEGSISDSDKHENGGAKKIPDTVTLRALLSTKEAGAIIGKGGKNVADLREVTGVKAGVSNAIPQVPDRVLTVSGSIDQISRVMLADNNRTATNVNYE